VSDVGRHLLAQMPRTMSDRLNRLDLRNKALKTLLHKQADDADVLLGPAAVGIYIYVCLFVRVCVYECIHIHNVCIYSAQYSAQNVATQANRRRRCASGPICCWCI